jgi:hypothetical protein
MLIVAVLYLSRFPPIRPFIGSSLPSIILVPFILFKATTKHSYSDFKAIVASRSDNRVIFKRSRSVRVAIAMRLRNIAMRLRNIAMRLRDIAMCFLCDCEAFA